MATFLDICQKVRKKSGLQGTGPSSVTAATGVENVLVGMVQDAWLDIQNFRENWRWMRSSADFLINAASTESSLMDILGITYRFRDWLHETAYIYVGSKWTPMRYIPYDEFIYRTINITEGTIPYYFTVREEDGAILYPLTNAQYNMKIDYIKSPQNLTANSDVPELPVNYHTLIVYKGVTQFAVYVGNPDTADDYEERYDRLMRSVLRTQLDKKYFKVRGIA